MLKPICLWSGPRNVSTALMYSFAQHNDIKVVDEPLYGHYLRISGAPHPGRDEVLQTVNSDGAAIMRDLLAEQAQMGDTRLFMKHMAHHLVDLDLDFLQQTRNILLIRNPREMLPSLTIQLPDARLEDTGLQHQWDLYKSLAEAGRTPTILDSRELLLNPENVLRELCRRIELPFTTRMLRWEAGPRPEDGVWARHWYHTVHQSTGFAPYRAKSGFPKHLNNLLDECKPWYDLLFAEAIHADANGDSP